ncbi:M1 family metallopeptidase [Lunatibacter salilacus]|uniref:M1 family metallopeptidase n=1 Tax=Lunatibacter salilacus TaxID=2483804 RepID=UPI00131DFB9C|nr:M1 family metallopeptidase [Lunatibacter salilacus]
MTKTSFIFIIFLLSFSFSGITESLYAQQSESWNWGGPMDPHQKKFRVSHYHLDLEILPNSQEIAGSTTLSVRYLENTDTLRLDLVSQYIVNDVKGDGHSLTFVHQNDLLDIRLDGKKPDKVTVYYHGKTPIASNPPWSGGFTWEKDSQGDHWMGLSSQNEGGKIFMPCLDHPKNKPANGVSLSITVPAIYSVAANGRLKGTVEDTGKKTFHWESNYPIMNYNINFTMGKFHMEKGNFRGISGDEIPMVAYVLEENKDKAPLLLEVLKKSTETHEHFFGAYPFPEDKIAVVETPYLGMEHQTINAYGNNFQFVRMGEVWYDWLLHHELGHEWFGNKVSISDWSDYWIHEGITSYGDWLFYLKHDGEEAYHEKVADAKKRIKNDLPVVSPPESHSDIAYHPDVYTKGAFIMHSLRFMLGDDAFFPLLQGIAHQEVFTYANQASTVDLIDYLSKDSDLDIKEFLSWYLYREDLPKVSVKKKKKNIYLISLPGSTFSLPIDVKTEKGIERITLSSTPIEVNSSAHVEVDPLGWYLLDK